MADPLWLSEAQKKWTNTGTVRPPFSIEPADGQESVWDYPRPPIIVADRRRVLISSNNIVVVNTTTSIRILETASPPTFYFNPLHVNTAALHPADGSSHCEWKGKALYWSLVPGGHPIGWSYPEPYDDFAGIANWFSFYPAHAKCTVDGEVVRPQAGGFYGGWVTNEIVGPYKGERGTQGW